jgi:hypothetical protein
VSARQKAWGSTKTGCTIELLRSPHERTLGLHMAMIAVSIAGIETRQRVLEEISA